MQTNFGSHRPYGSYGNLVFVGKRLHARKSDRRRFGRPRAHDAYAVRRNRFVEHDGHGHDRRGRGRLGQKMIRPFLRIRPFAARGAHLHLERCGIKARLDLRIQMNAFERRVLPVRCLQPHPLFAVRLRVVHGIHVAVGQGIKPRGVRADRLGKSALAHVHDEIIAQPVVAAVFHVNVRHARFFGCDEPAFRNIDDRRIVAVKLDICDLRRAQNARFHIVIQKFDAQLMRGFPHTDTHVRIGNEYRLGRAARSGGLRRHFLQSGDTAVGFHFFAHFERDFADSRSPVYHGGV